jgi:hypothetical protein
MCIDTESFIMCGEIKRTPDSFKIEHIKIIIILQIMYQFNDNIILTVCKGTVFTIITGQYLVRIERAKFSFVLVRLVQLFHTVMCFHTLVTVWTIFSLFNEFTQISRIEIPHTFSVFHIVIKRAMFVVVRPL